MLVRIKYWLLKKLVKDICRKSDCDNCQLCMELPWQSPCRKGAILNQARRVWGNKGYMDGEQIRENCTSYYGKRAYYATLAH